MQEVDHRLGFTKEVVWGLKVVRLGFFQGFLVKDDKATPVSWHQVQAQGITAYRPLVFALFGEHPPRVLAEQPTRVVLVPVRTVSTPETGASARKGRVRGRGWEVVKVDLDVPACQLREHLVKGDVAFGGLDREAVRVLDEDAFDDL
ncbi:MAG: hypothetical protein CMJ67_10130 [Planctomycetaceae bacterium]|nr:hypothetical protein [Planctomycetaceae bacterium]